MPDPFGSVGGPSFEDLEVGQRFDGAPALTLTEGAATLHQAIVGDRLRLPLDHRLARAVTGLEAPPVHPALVWDVAIGQSTLATHRVLANLFYRGLVLRRHPVLGDTLRTATQITALKETSRKPGRAPRGLAVLRVRTVDQEDRPVLDFRRCAMLPLRGEAPTGRDDELDGDAADLPDTELLAAWEGWDLAALSPATGLEPGAAWSVEGGDVVSSAPELARLSLNVAMAHHDQTATGTGRRLVYGGHTIGIAAAQATRLFPDLATIVGWHGCDHLGPVYEGDTLKSHVAVERRDGHLAHLRSRVSAVGEGGEPRDVLDWRWVGVVA